MRIYIYIGLQPRLSTRRRTGKGRRSFLMLNERKEKQVYDQLLHPESMKRRNSFTAASFNQLKNLILNCNQTILIEPKRLIRNKIFLLVLPILPHRSDRRARYLATTRAPRETIFHRLFAFVVPSNLFEMSLSVSRNFNAARRVL